jgi:hypothetical protein
MSNSISVVMIGIPGPPGGGSSFTSLPTVQGPTSASAAVDVVLPIDASGGPVTVTMPACVVDAVLAIQDVNGLAPSGLLATLVSPSGTTAYGQLPSSGLGYGSSVGLLSDTASTFYFRGSPNGQWRPA